MFSNHIVLIGFLKKIILFSILVSGLSARGQQTYVTENDIQYYSESISDEDGYIKSQCTLNIYYPKGLKNYSTVIWFHGGGLTGGSKEIPKALMNQGFAVIGVEYRLSPKVTAPAYINDAAAAVAWVFRHISEYGGNPNLIFVSGHSAGGYLGLMVALNKKYLADYQIDANRIAELISFSGQAITHFTIREERGIKNTQPIVDDFAPLYFVREDAPQILLITGDREMELLGRYEENAYLLRMLKLSGHKGSRLYELQGFDHGGMAEPAFPLLIKEVNKTTEKILGKAYK